MARVAESILRGVHLGGGLRNGVTGKAGELRQVENERRSATALSQKVSEDGAPRDRVELEARLFDVKNRAGKTEEEARDKGIAGVIRGSATRDGRDNGTDKLTNDKQSVLRASHERETVFGDEAGLSSSAAGNAAGKEKAEDHVEEQQGDSGVEQASQQEEGQVAGESQHMLGQSFKEAGRTGTEAKLGGEGEEGDEERLGEGGETKCIHCGTKQSKRFSKPKGGPGLLCTNCSSRFYQGRLTEDYKPAVRLTPNRKLKGLLESADEPEETPEQRRARAAKRRLLPGEEDSEEEALKVWRQHKFPTTDKVAKKRQGAPSKERKAIGRPRKHAKKPLSGVKRKHSGEALEKNGSFPRKSAEVTMKSVRSTKGTAGGKMLGKPGRKKKGLPKAMTKGKRKFVGKRRSLPWLMAEGAALEPLAKKAKAAPLEEEEVAVGAKEETAVQGDSTAGEGGGTRPSAVAEIGLGRGMLPCAEEEGSCGVPPPADSEAEAAPMVNPLTVHAEQPGAHCSPGELPSLVSPGTQDSAELLPAVPAKAADQSEGLGGQGLQVCRHPGCGKMCSDVMALGKHVRSHGERPYACHYPSCDKRFTEKSKLTRHFLIHTGEKPFVCPFDGCSKAFSLDFNLRSHVRTHTGEGFSCPFQGCYKRYVHQYKLKAHLMQHHHQAPEAADHLIGPMVRADKDDTEQKDEKGKTDEGLLLGKEGGEGGKADSGIGKGGGASGEEGEGGGGESEGMSLEEAPPVGLPLDLDEKSGEQRAEERREKLDKRKAKLEAKREAGSKRLQELEAERREVTKEVARVDRALKRLAKELQKLTGGCPPWKPTVGKTQFAETAEASERQEQEIVTSLQGSGASASLSSPQAQRKAPPQVQVPVKPTPMYSVQRVHAAPKYPLGMAIGPGSQPLISSALRSSAGFSAPPLSSARGQMVSVSPLAAASLALGRGVTLLPSPPMQAGLQPLAAAVPGSVQMLPLGVPGEVLNPGGQLLVGHGPGSLGQQHGMAQVQSRGMPQGGPAIMMGMRYGAGAGGQVLPRGGGSQPVPSRGMAIGTTHVGFAGGFAGVGGSRAGTVPLPPPPFSMQLRGEVGAGMGTQALQALPQGLGRAVHLRPGLETEQGKQRGQQRQVTEQEQGKLWEKAVQVRLADEEALQPSKEVEGVEGLLPVQQPGEVEPGEALLVKAPGLGPQSQPLLLDSTQTEGSPATAGEEEKYVSLPEAPAKAPSETGDETEEEDEEEKAERAAMKAGVKVVIKKHDLAGERSTGSREDGLLGQLGEDQGEVSELEDVEKGETGPSGGEWGPAEDLLVEGGLLGEERREAKTPVEDVAAESQAPCLERSKGGDEGLSDELGDGGHRQHQPERDDVLAASATFLLEHDVALGSVL